MKVTAAKQLAVDLIIRDVSGSPLAIKYRSLAEVEGGYDRLSPTVRSLVVAYDTEYPTATALADRYAVDLVAVDPRRVLAAAI